MIGRTVVLHHVVGPGDAHYDWLIQSPSDGWTLPPLRVPTFRLGVNALAQPTGCVLRAERLPDHRVHYFEHEGDIGRGRGSVRRVATGRVLRWTERPGRIDLLLESGDAEQAWIARAVREPGWWEWVRVASAEDSG
ncbi:MAG: hypothetical protein ACTS22_05055 [Phycisphaerales bacterium]